jgi:transcriptional regulator
VRGVIGRLTRTHEASQPQPWKMADAPKDYLDTMTKAIVGLQIDITRLVGKSKLSQNKEARDIRGAGEALIASGNPAIGEEMLARVAGKPE